MERIIRNRFTLLLRNIAILAFLFTSVFSFAQQNSLGQIIDSSKVVQPVAIQTINVIAKIEEANNKINEIERKIGLTSDIKNIDSLFPIYISFLKEQKKQTQKFVKKNPNRQKINHLVSKWERYYTYLNNWESDINKHQDDYEVFIKEGSFEGKTWDLTYQNAVSEKVPYEVLKNIKSVRDRIIKTKKSIFNRKNHLLSLESKINKQKTFVTNVIHDLNTLKKSDIYDVFYLRKKPLWKTSFQSLEESSNEKELVEPIPKKFSVIFDLIKKSENNIYLYLILIVVIIFIINFIKKVYTKYSFDEQDRDLQQAKDIIVNHSLSTIIFLSLLIAFFFSSSVHILISKLLLLIILFVSVSLVKPYMYSRFKTITYVVILFFSLDVIKNYVWFTDLQYRYILLFEAFLIIANLLFFTYPYSKTRKLTSGRFGKLLVRVTPLLYFLSIVSIVSNVLGYTNLSELAVKICTNSSVITIVFYGVLMIAEGIITGIIHSLFTRKVSFDQNKKFDIEKKALKIIRVIVVFYWFYFFLEVVDLWLPITEYLSQKISRSFVIGTLSFTIGSILSFILILTISYLVTSFISFLLDGDSLKSLKLPKGIPTVISLVVRYFIIAFGIVLALSSLGIDLSKFNLMAGALGLGIGFGLQTVISNFISGLILIFERPILPGDTVEVNNLLGKVKRIGVRSSTISTFDGAEVVVPNNNLVADDLINWTLSNNIKRIEVSIGTKYGSDPNEILKILSNVANENPDVLKNPAPLILFDEFGDSSLNFKLRFWVPYEIGLQVKSDVSIAVYNKFKEFDIEIPFPQQDVHIKNMPTQMQPVKKMEEPDHQAKKPIKKIGQLIEPMDENTDAEE